MQLSRLLKTGQIAQIRQGLYCFDPGKIDELALANILYPRSYISLETALNYYGLIPDIPLAVTSITMVTTKKITNRFGQFYYFKIKPELFFGFNQIKSANDEMFFDLAEKEKALLDYFYLRKASVSALRLKLKDLDLKSYNEYAKSYPKWVQKIKLNE